MSNTSFWSLGRLLLVAGVALGVGATPALTAKKKDPAATARNDPHSGAWLNREAARRARAAGFTGGKSAPPRIALPAVNDPNADATAQDTQSETTIANFGGGNLIASFNDSGSFLGGASHFTGYAFSADNGFTWTDAGKLPDSSAGDAGDPVLAVDKTLNGTGAVYLGTLAFNGSPFPIQIFKSTDMGHTFAPPVPAGGVDADKDWLAVDNFSGAGQHNLYVCYTEFGVSPAEIRFNRSTDGGITFGTPLTIAGGGPQVQGCFLTVSPDHQVNIYYFKGAAGANDIFTRRSTDGGLTFFPEVHVAHLHTASVNGDLGLLGGFRSNSFPHAAVLPTGGGYQYVVYNDLNAATPANKADIYVVRSTDGGATWSAAQHVNDDTAGDQYMPTVAITPGGQLMFGYYSRSHDPDNLLFHRRGRLGSANVSGSVAFHKSFQLSPDTPIAIGQDAVVNSVYMGDYDQIAAGGSFFSTWADNRFGDSFHLHQPDVHFAQIAPAPANADLGVSVTASPASISLGQNVTFTVTASATGNGATDAFLAMNPVSGLLIQSVNSPGGACSTANGIAGCSLGSIPAGSSKSIQVVATGITAGGTRTFAAVGTASTIDGNSANNTGSASVAVSGGSTVTTTYSSGNIAVPIADLSSVSVPLVVRDTGVPVRVKAFVRLDHTFDSDLRLTLISPTGKTALLSNHRGGGGDNYGSGTNDCSGTFAVFSDTATTPIAAGAAPFAGLFKPEQPLSGVLGDPIDGGWKLKFEDTAAGDTGTIGCVKVQITRLP